MNNNLLFVDTETSGVPRSFEASTRETEGWPFVLQIAWLIYDPTGRLIKEENHFIWESEIFIESSSINIHGITEDNLKERGEDRKAVMWKFLNDLKKYKPTIVGHFVEFDSKMIQVAMNRSGLRHNLSKYPHFCTMTSSSDYARFTNHNYPKLKELYVALFGRDMDEAHDAKADAEATAKCFFELYRRGEVDEQKLLSPGITGKVKKRVQDNTGCGLPVLLFLIVGLIIVWL